MTEYKLRDTCPSKKSFKSNDAPISTAHLHKLDTKFDLDPFANIMDGYKDENPTTITTEETTEEDPFTPEVTKEKFNRKKIGHRVNTHVQKDRSDKDDGYQRPIKFKKQPESFDPANLSKKYDNSSRDTNNRPNRNRTPYDTSKIPCKYGETCNNKENCKFSHVAPQPQIQVACKYGETCNNKENCKFSHTIPYDPSQVPCKFGSSCKRYPNCSFKHKPNTNEAQTKQIQERDTTLSETKDKQCSNPCIIQEGSFEPSTGDFFGRSCSYISPNPTSTSHSTSPTSPSLPSHNQPTNNEMYNTKCRSGDLCYYNRNGICRYIH